MARQKKRWPLETIQDSRTDVKIEIFYNSNNNMHEAEFGGDSISVQTVNEVRSWAKKQIDQSLQFDWIAIMEINNKLQRWNHTTHYSKTLLSISRYYVAIDSRGMWRRVTWDIPSDSRLNNMKSWSYYPHYLPTDKRPPFVLPLHQVESGDSELTWDTHYLAYDQAIWENLLVLVEGMHLVSMKIAELVGTESGLDTLTLPGGIPLLLAPPSIVLSE